MPDSNDLSRRQVFQASSTLALAPANALSASPNVTGADYIVQRLKELGVDMFFGVPGATCDAFFEAAHNQNLKVIVTSTDMEAGYAADGYARIKGLSAVSVTYGVGMMALLPVVAGAYAERSAMVVINGGPSSEDLRLQDGLHTLFSHSSGKPHSDLHMFEEVTCFAKRIERKEDIASIVDEALLAARLKQRPVYIEVPKDLWRATLPSPEKPLNTQPVPTGNEATVAKNIVSFLQAGKSPALILGIEISRFQLQDQVEQLLAKWSIPFATTLLAKSVVNENTNGFVGVYGGERALSLPKQTIEQSDALLSLGVVLSRQHRRMAQKGKALAHVGDSLVSIAGGKAASISLPFLMKELLALPFTKPAGKLENVGSQSFSQRRKSLSPNASRNEAGVSYDEAMQSVSDVLDENSIVLTDTSLSMYPAAELQVRGRNSFVCNAAWQAIGFSPAACIGVALAQKKKPFVICGDGGFQMTAQALSTLARLEIPSVILILDNGSYGIEQWILQPKYFSGNENLKPHLKLPRWNYEALSRAMGVTHAFTVESVEKLNQALKDSKENLGPTVISVRIKEHSLPMGLS
jgi:indolepyruvate decarboxylase